MARDFNATEKEALEHIEPETAIKHDGLDDSFLPAYDDKETTKILRKVDYRLVPLLTLLYVLGEKI